MYMNLIHWLFVLPLCVILCCKSFYYWFQIFLPHILFWPIQQPNVYVFELKTGIKVLVFFLIWTVLTKSICPRKLKDCSQAARKQNAATYSEQRQFVCLFLVHFLAGKAVSLIGFDSKDIFAAKIVDVKLLLKQHFQKWKQVLWYGFYDLKRGGIKTQLVARGSN